jgi:hypothetical protein
MVIVTVLPSLTRMVKVKVSAVVGAPASSLLASAAGQLDRSLSPNTEPGRLWFTGWTG